MNRIFVSLFVLLLIFLGACESSAHTISKEEVKSIVVEQNSGSIGEIKIISVRHTRGKYIVEWENKQNCERGTQYIDDQSGEITKGKVSIC